MPLHQAAGQDSGAGCHTPATAGHIAEQLRKINHLYLLLCSLCNNIFDGQTCTHKNLYASFFLSVHSACSWRGLCYPGHLRLLQPGSKGGGQKFAAAWNNSPHCRHGYPKHLRAVKVGTHVFVMLSYK